MTAKLNTRDRRALIVLIIAAAAVLLYCVAVAPWLEHWSDVRAEIDLKRADLERIGMAGQKDDADSDSPTGKNDAAVATADGETENQAQQEPEKGSDSQEKPKESAPPDASSGNEGSTEAKGQPVQGGGEPEKSPEKSAEAGIASGKDAPVQAREQQTQDSDDPNEKPKTDDTTADSSSGEDTTQAKEQQAQSKDAPERLSREEQLVAAVPVFEMPIEAQAQRMRFRGKFHEQLKKSGFKIQSLQYQGKARRQTGLRYRLLALQCRMKGNITQLFDFLAELNANPHLVGVEELRVKCEEGNPANIDVSMTVTTFVP